MSRDDSRNDQQLIAAINAGSTDAFEALYLRYRDWVVGLAQRFTGSREDALDVMQETFSYVLRKFPGFELTCQFKTFLYPAVKHLSIAHRKKRRREMPTDSPALEEGQWQPPEAGGLEDLATAIGGLGEIHREVILLRFVDGLNMQEIGQALDIPPGTVKSRLHHAIAKLREDPMVREYFDVE
jgi:RNA polymerase sigma-70 factor (ECF subfamily)